MLTEPDALLSMDAGAADIDGACVPVPVGVQCVVAPVESGTPLPHPSLHNISDEHGDGKNKFLFIVIQLWYII